MQSHPKDIGSILEEANHALEEVLGQFRLGSPPIFYSTPIKKPPGAPKKSLTFGPDELHYFDKEDAPAHHLSMPPLMLSPTKPAPTIAPKPPGLSGLPPSKKKAPPKRPLDLDETIPAVYKRPAKKLDLQPEDWTLGEDDFDSRSPKRLGI
jgi:hypothetical protein